MIIGDLEKEVSNVALFVVYHELLKKNNPILNNHLNKLGSMDRFMSYYRSIGHSNNPSFQK